MQKRKIIRLAVIPVMAALVMSACGSSKSSSSSTTAAANGGTSGGSGNSASAPGVTKSTVTVGFETDLTGVASSTFDQSAQGIQARFAAQNAQGGVNGRTLNYVTEDTASTPIGAQTAAQALVTQKNAFAVAEVSALFFGASAYLQKAGVPTIGTSLDGPEWYTQPNTNMFNIEGTGSPHYPSYTTQGTFWKSLGVKKISFVASNTPSSTRAVNQEINSIKAAGLQTCADQIVPLGAADFTGVSLSIKNAGCDAAECSCVLSSSLAMSSALQNLGLNVPMLFEAGPDPGVFQSAATQKAANNAYFTAAINYSGSAYDSMISALKKYTTFTGSVPNLGVIDGWQVADLFIKGLQAAGQNPTRKSFITNLRQLTSWDAEGLKPAAVVFNPFGVSPQQGCFAYLKFSSGQYNGYPANGKTFCGTLLPNSNVS
jgi:branched-chain amino acid transport system substrate-binding protein